MAALKKAIDLLPREGFEYTTLGRILTWALSAGRIIVILTELIVILAFLSRFWLDRTLTDLNSQIEQRIAIIAASSEFEKDFRQLQSALSAFSQITTSEPNVKSILEETVSSLPGDVSLQAFTISENEIQIKGVSLSELGIAGFIKNLKDREFEDIKLTGISFGAEGEIGINFSLSTKLKEAETRGI